MNITPINFNCNNSKSRKIKNSNFKTITSNTKDFNNFANISFRQLPKMNNVSFKGNNVKLDNLTKLSEMTASLIGQENPELKILVNEAIANATEILKSPLIEKDKENKTFFHKSSYGELKSKKQEITPQLLKTALPIQDNQGNTFAYYDKEPEFVDTIVNILSDEASETLSKILIKTNKNNGTFLHNNQSPETIKAYAKGLKDKAPEIFAKVCTTINKSGDTPISIMIKNNQQEQLKAVFEITGDKTPEILAKVCTIKDQDGKTPIDIMIRNNNEELMAEIFKIIDNKTPEVIRKNYISENKYKETFAHRAIKPNVAEIIVNNMGDETIELLSKILITQDENEKTFLHYGQYIDTVKIYAKGLKDKAPEIFAKVCTIKDEEGNTPIDIMIEQNKQEMLKVIFEILGDKIPEVINGIAF